MIQGNCHLGITTTTHDNCWTDTSEIKMFRGCRRKKIPPFILHTYLSLETNIVPIHHTSSLHPQTFTFTHIQQYYLTLNTTFINTYQFFIYVLGLIGLQDICGCRDEVSVEYGWWMICACLVSFMPVPSLHPWTFMAHASFFFFFWCSFMQGKEVVVWTKSGVSVFVCKCYVSGVSVFALKCYVLVLVFIVVVQTCYTIRKWMSNVTNLPWCVWERVFWVPGDVPTELGYVAWMRGGIGGFVLELWAVDCRITKQTT